MSTPTELSMITAVMSIESGRDCNKVEMDDTRGGYTDRSFDGHRTNWGWTQETLFSLGIDTDVKDLTFQDAYLLYRRVFMVKSGADRILPTNPHLAAAMFNISVNAGWHTGVRLLQELLNTHNGMGSLWHDIAEDGLFGKQTRLAYDAYMEARWSDGKDILTMGYLVQFANHYMDITKLSNRNEKYFYGWQRRAYASFLEYFEDVIEAEKKED